jgi:hypothetical protein
MEPGTRPQRIGVIVPPRPRLNEAALQSFVLAMNKEQSLIQFEFYKTGTLHPLMAVLSTKRKPVNRDWLEDQLPDFTDSLHRDLADARTDYDAHEDIPDQFVIISQCRFSDEYYATRVGTLAVIALGNWRRLMAPPSLLEFIQVLLVREAVAILCPSLDGSIHLGTKSCLMDFTPYLPEARQKAIAGYVCSFCASLLLDNGNPELLAAVSHLVDREWLGSSADPRSPAGISANLGADLFIVKGLRATPRERLINTFREESVKQIAVAVGVIAAAAALFFLLGIKG